MKNVLMIIVDCARTEKTLLDFPLGSPGTQRSAQLPFLDSLREKGTTWTNLNAISSTTTPNFASMFTGLLPSEHGIIEHSRHCLKPGLSTLADILRENGYHTYAEMAGPLIPEAGLDRGFDHYTCRPRTAYLHMGFYEYLARFISTLSSPWFFCLHLWEAHEPYQNPPPFNQRQYGFTPHDQALSLVDSYLTKLFNEVNLENAVIIYTSDHGERLVEDYILNQDLKGEEWRVLLAHQQYISHSPGIINYDEWFQWLKAALGEVTARIYAHNVVGHGFHLTEDLIRIPLVIVDSDLCEKGVNNSSLRSQVDIFPTVLDLTGIPIPEGLGIRGQSLLDKSGEDKIYIEANGSGGKQFESRCYLRGAKTESWKYWKIENSNEPHAVLWDLVSDPRETLNCIREQPEVVEGLDQFVSEQLSDGSLGEEQDMDSDEMKKIEEKLRELGYI